MGSNKKNYHFDSEPKIISHFGGTNNIFVDSIVGENILYISRAIMLILHKHKIVIDVY